MLEPTNNFSGPLINGTNKEVLDEIAALAAEFDRMRQPLYKLLGQPLPIPPFGGTDAKIGLGRISGVSGSSPNFLYKATSLDGVCADVPQFIPPGGRYFGAADIVAANVGDLCLLVQPSGSGSGIIQLTEKADYANCPSSGSGFTGLTGANSAFAQGI